MEDVNRKNDKSSNENCQDNGKPSNDKEKSTFEHPLVETPSKLYGKPMLMKEEPYDQRFFSEKISYMTSRTSNRISRSNLSHIRRA